MNEFQLIGLVAVLGMLPRAQVHSESVAQHCTPPRYSEAEYSSLVDSLLARSGKQIQGGGYPQLEGHALAVPTAKGCELVVALKWDGELGGGVLFLDGARRVRGVDPRYAGARSLRLAGRDRVALEYTASRSSGSSDSQHVVLCRVGASMWVECLSLASRKETHVEDAPDVYFREQNTLSFRRDSAIVNRTVRYRRASDRAEHRLAQAYSIALP